MCMYIFSAEPVLLKILFPLGCPLLALRSRVGKELWVYDHWQVHCRVQGGRPLFFICVNFGYEKFLHLDNY
jgi:hypothetical protein